MVTGTAFYAYEQDLGWSRGLYMAVNVGYSIGWGYPLETTDLARTFSTVYVLIGASAVAASLGYFASSMIASSKNWYVNALNHHHYKSSTALDKFIFWVKLNEGPLKIVSLWVFWILSMVTFSMCTVKWSFGQALYFAVSSLSTGGLWAIPTESPDWYFGIGEHSFLL